MPKITMTPEQCLEEIENYLGEAESKNENILRLFAIVDGLRDWCIEAEENMNKVERAIYDAESCASEFPESKIIITT